MYGTPRLPGPVAASSLTDVWGAGGTDSESGWLPLGWSVAGAGHAETRRLDQVREQHVRGREVDYGDTRADDGDVAASNRAIVVRVPNDEEGQEHTEQRREECEQQHDQGDHDQVGDVVREVRELDLPPPLPAGGPAAVRLKISTAGGARGGERMNRLAALRAAVRARHHTPR